MSKIKLYAVCLPVLMLVTVMGVVSCRIHEDVPGGAAGPSAPSAFSAPSSPGTPVTSGRFVLCGTKEGSADKGVGIPNLRWPNGSTLKVLFMNGEPNLQSMTISAAQEWSNHANLKFVQVHNVPADIRVSFAGPGHWSRLGIEAQNYKQTVNTMNLERSALLDSAGMLRKDEVRRVAIHEFGHAIGLYHEHLFPDAENPIIIDKEALIAFYMENQGWGRKAVLDNVINRIDAKISMRSTYDAFSVMHYPIPSSCARMNPNWKGKLPKTPLGYLIYFNQVLSSGDKEFVRTFYPKA